MVGMFGVFKHSALQQLLRKSGPLKSTLCQLPPYFPNIIPLIYWKFSVFCGSVQGRHRQAGVGRFAPQPNAQLEEAVGGFFPP